jgi:PHD/YefM family antitoxin component YafN of YafNO toxin-antitoxin module
MYFSESESDGSLRLGLRGNERKDVEDYIHSTRQMIRAFKQSSHKEISVVAPPPAAVLLSEEEKEEEKELIKGLSQEEILERYNQIKEQLLFQSQYLSTAKDRTRRDNGLLPQSYLSWPEHFHRQRKHLKQPDPLTPWEGSQYMWTLLTSLADKLLLKYSFQSLRQSSQALRRGKRSADLLYARRCGELVSLVFSAWREQCQTLLHLRLITARGHRCGVALLMRRGYRRWKEFLSWKRRYLKLDHLVRERWRQQRCRQVLLSWRARLRDRANRRRKLVPGTKRRENKRQSHSGALVQKVPHLSASQSSQYLKVLVPIHPPLSLSLSLTLPSSELQ